MLAEKSPVVRAAAFTVLWIAGMALLTAFTSNGSVSTGSAISLAIGGTVAGALFYWLTKRHSKSISRRSPL